MPSSRYRIKETAKDEGCGRFHLYQDGNWCSTHTTREEADAELAARERFGLSMHKRHSTNTQEPNYEADDQ